MGLSCWNNLWAEPGVAWALGAPHQGGTLPWPCYPVGAGDKAAQRLSRKAGVLHLPLVLKKERETNRDRPTTDRHIWRCFPLFLTSWAPVRCYGPSFTIFFYLYEFRTIEILLYAWLSCNKVSMGKNSHNFFWKFIPINLFIEVSWRSKLIGSEKLPNVTLLWILEGLWTWSIV
jgi:hypothetical protein